MNLLMSSGLLISDFGIVDVATGDAPTAGGDTVVLQPVSTTTAQDPITAPTTALDRTPAALR